MKVEIRWKVDQEDTPVRGNASAIDPETDDKIASEIERRLDSGDVWAWCVVFCEARIEIEGETFIGHDSIGGCSYKDRADFEAGGYAKDMRAGALQDAFDVMGLAVKRGEIAAKGIKAGIKSARRKARETWGE